MLCRIVLEHRQGANDGATMIHEDDHRMTVGIAFQPGPELSPTTHAFVMADPRVIGPSESGAVAQKRLADRGTRDHREGGRIEHGIGDVLPLSAQVSRSTMPLATSSAVSLRPTFGFDAPYHSR